MEKIDEVVLEVKDNVLMAEEEIIQAEKESKGNRNKILWIVGIIVIVVVVIILIIVLSK